MGDRYANGAVTAALQAAMAGVDGGATDGVKQDGSAAKKANPVKARRAAGAANRALRKAGAFKPYSTQSAAEDAWAAIVGPIEAKYGVELGSHVYSGPNGYVFGPVYSSGNVDAILGFWDVKHLDNVSRVGFIHAHPTAGYFSGMDDGASSATSRLDCFSGGRASANCGGDLPGAWDQGVDAAVVVNGRVSMRWDYQAYQQAVNAANGASVRMGDYAR